MALPTNILQAVETYNDAGLGYLQNLCCMASTFNQKYKNFENVTAQLGETILLELPTRSTVSKGLVASFQATADRKIPLTCDQAANAGRAFSAQQFVFNADQYMDKYGRADVAELGADIEKNLGLNAISAVPVYTVDNNGQSVPTGALHTESGPFRFYGDGTTPLNSSKQIAQILANNDSFGSPTFGRKLYLPNDIIPEIVNNNLQQFALNRNNAEAMSWDLGDVGGCNIYQSNLLPIHTAGTLGDDATELTVVSTNDPTGENITEITCSGAGTDSTAVRSGDLGYFVDGVVGFNDMRYLTWVGKNPTNLPVQFKIVSNAASSAGSVTLVIDPNYPLVSAPGANQNLNQPIQAGMKIKILPTHRAGLFVTGDAAYMAMPTLPNEDPFTTSTQTDPETGLSLRTYYGSQFGKNFRGLIHDAIWCSLVVPEYSMRIILPV
jgi:hypothetical protein